MNKVTSQLHGVFGTPEHHAMTDTPVPRAVPSNSESNLVSPYCPKVRPPLVNEEELSQLRKGQDISWCLEYADRNTHSEEVRIHAELSKTLIWHNEEPASPKTDPRILIWEQQTGVLHRREPEYPHGPEHSVQISYVSPHIGKAQQAIVSPSLDPEVQANEHNTHDSVDMHQVQPKDFTDTDTDYTTLDWIPFIALHLARRSLYVAKTQYDILVIHSSTATCLTRTRTLSSLTSPDEQMDRGVHYRKRV